MGKIQFEGLEFYSYHGLLEEEQIIGGKFLVDIEIDLDFSQALATDQIEGTIDYSRIFEVIKIEMDKKSKLIEHVAGRIVSMLFVTFKMIESVKLKLTKLKPPISGKVNSVSVIVEKARIEL